MGTLDEWFKITGKHVKLGIKATLITGIFLGAIVVSGLIAITDAINGYTNWPAIVVSGGSVLVLTYLLLIRWK